MAPVTCGVSVTARKKHNGWDLALNNGDVLFVPVLDDAVTRVRTHLNLHQPTIDHHRVTVTLAIEPDPTPEMAKDIDGMSLTLRFLAARGASTDFAGAASQVLHWVDDLPELYRRQCLSDLWVALKVANEDFRYGPLEDAVSRWRPGAAPAPTTAPAPAPEPTYTAPDPEPIDLLPRASPPPEAPPMSSPGYLSGFPEHSYAPPERPTWAARPSRPARATQQHESGRHRL